MTLPNESDFHDAFRRAINEHGYAFQYRALKEVRDALQSIGSSFRFVASELPAGVQHGRIDFILEQERPRTLIAVECKRVNPAFGSWLFLRSPAVTRLRTADWIQVDYIHGGGPGAMLYQCRKGKDITTNAYHVAVAVRTKNRGNTEVHSTDEIEKAVSQACAGASGLADERLWGHGWVSIMPMMLTTANLFVSEVKLDESGLNTGDIEPSALVPKRVDWLYYQYPVSRGLRSWAHSRRPSQDLAQLADLEHIRTVPVVSAAAIKPFFQQFDLGDLQLMFSE